MLSMPDLPAHASPSIHPTSAADPTPPRGALAQLNFNDYYSSQPPALVSPAFTPPSTPGTGRSTPPLHAHPIASPEAAPDQPSPPLLKTLPNVECQVRARIPTTTGVEMFLHLYTNDADNKEHLAIVFGNKIRSRSLDRPRPGETEYDRMVRGAYVGRLYPGRTTSRVEQIKRDEGVVSAPGIPNGLKRTHPHQQHTTGSNGVEASTADAPEPADQREEPDRQPTDPSLPLVRIHSECYTGETVWSARCDCGEQLDEAARLMSHPSSNSASPGGVIVYLRQEGRGIGLGEKLKAYNLQDLGNDTYEANLILRHPADARSYGLATAMLVDLGLGSEDPPDGLGKDSGIRLLTNNPDKVRAVEGQNREVIVRERVEMVPLAWKTRGKEGIRSEEVERYLGTKVCHEYVLSLRVRC